MEPMKLYTEEQVRQAWNTAYTDALSIDEPDYKPKFYDEFIQSLTPIQLPTDEEIEELSRDVIVYNDIKRGWWVDGAKWMRDKIQGGNK